MKIRDTKSNDESANNSLNGIQEINSSTIQFEDSGLDIKDIPILTHI